ncbi:hypothetical protein D8674_009027 [Pyrus ussuriensis x Pyrus communis]|uniref:Uncharacterized protein n=1 Tax=Pyrus ussuriensis x Pyrus communis TaxID=2448454 RepID=A0A5N5HVG3_9ROSA|nr:hypothetical protein D8674_009027 [Pyrus ussuriensis x Pyrus communis]
MDYSGAIQVVAAQNCTAEEVVIDIDESAVDMQSRLEQNRREIPTTKNRSSVCIYRVPPGLAGISPKAIQPEIVSIGPYHHGKKELSEFQSYKWWFLDRLLWRTKRGLQDYVKAMSRLEKSTRNCYSDHHELSVSDFVEMMVLDGCFIIELFRFVCESNDDDHVVDENDREGNPILATPWLIPILTRDLLKLENQLPFSVLETLYDISRDQRKAADPKHLLDLFYSSLIPQNPITDPSALAGKSLLHFCFRPQKQSTVPNGPSTRKNKKKEPNDPSQKYCPSSESIQCTVQLRSSGIKFKPQRADSFLEINFQGSVISRCKELQIPPITINDFTTTLFINCMALEQCRQNSPTWFTTYIAFMSSLITSPRDVTFLCSDGIVTTGFSYNDQKVAKLFKKLGEKAGFNIRECYLSKQFTDVEAYYSSCRATFIRNYFSRPWSFISVLYAVFLFVLTLGQTVFSILSYINDRS